MPYNNMEKIDEVGNEARMARGELYYAFTPILYEYRLSISVSRVPFLMFAQYSDQRLSRIS
jgi:hypothetical protein